MAVVGGFFTLVMGRVMEKLNTKHLLLVGLGLCALAPVPTAVMSRQDMDFWKHIFPTSIISVMGIAITYCTITVVALASVPLGAKSLCGGMINTAFQIGSGVGLALASAIVDSTETNKGHGPLAQYTTGMWCCVGLAGVGFLSSLGVKSVKTGHLPAVPVH
jgi:predicted MFS family arabinose efflux permease